MNALANPEVGKFVNAHFVSAFQKVATFRIANGQKQGGNVATYFCAPDGRVLHVIAGPVDAATMLAESKWIIQTVRSAIEAAKGDGAKFKLLLRKAHAERLRAEHGVVVEPLGFDPPTDSNENTNLTYRDPTGNPLAPKLPPPPIEGPDVRLTIAEQNAKAASAPGVRDLQDCRGRCIRLGNAGIVHQLMSAYACVRIEKLYGTVFENILGEKISTKPVDVVGKLPPRR